MLKTKTEYDKQKQTLIEENEKALAQQNSTQKPSIEFVDSLKEAVSIAKHLSSRQAIILFSPACASFDMFSNYIDGIYYLKLLITIK